MRPRALLLNPVTITGGVGDGLGGFGTGFGFSASCFDLGAGCFLAVAGSGACRLGPASSSDMGDNGTPFFASASLMLSNVRRK